MMAYNSPASTPPENPHSKRARNLRIALPLLKLLHGFLHRFIIDV